jgi:hypothetical protein
VRRRFESSRDTERARFIREQRRIRDRQRAEFGGLVNWGSAFFGWLVAVGLAALLTALLSAAGAAVGLTDNLNASASSAAAETVGIIGGSLLFAILCVSYLAGGYVAGRMSRFDGVRQGFGMWLFGVVIAGLLAAVGLLAGNPDYNLLGALNLPRVPVEEGALTTGGQIALAAIVVGTLIAAMVGGKIGERYHRRIDEAGMAPPPPAPGSPAGRARQPRTEAGAATGPS